MSGAMFCATSDIGTKLTDCAVFAVVGLEV